MGTEPASSSSTAIRNALGELRTTTRAFFDSPRALWGLNIPYLLEGISYFGVLTLLMKLLSENLGLGDIRAGIVVSLFTGGITFAMFFLGELGDRFGTRRVLLLSITVMAVGRVLLTAAGRLPGGGLTSPAFLVTALGLLVVVVGFGTFQPALFSAVKQYSDPSTSAVAFGVIYGLNNLGAFLAGFLSPMAREASASAFPPNGIQGVYGLYAVLTLRSRSPSPPLLLTPKLVKEALARRPASAALEAAANAGPKPRVFSAKWVAEHPLHGREVRLLRLHPHPGPDALRPQLADAAALHRPLLRALGQLAVRALLEPQPAPRLSPSPRSSPR